MTKLPSTKSAQTHVKHNFYFNEQPDAFWPVFALCSYQNTCTDITISKWKHKPNQHEINHDNEFVVNEIQKKKKERKKTEKKEKKNSRI